MNKPIIDLIDVRKIYHRGNEIIKALDGINLAVHAGEMISIVGPSGSGKTTLMNVIGCIDRITSGRIFLEGEDISDVKENELVKFRREKIGFVFQQFFLIPTLTAQENVAIPGLFSRFIDREQKADELLDLVGMNGRKDHFPHQLSGGEMQRVAIARSLINSPKLLLADEPTGSLDSDNTKQIFQLFKTLNNGGITVIIVTHNNEQAGKASKVLHLHDGRVITDAK